MSTMDTGSHYKFITGIKYTDNKGICLQDEDIRVRTCPVNGVIDEETFNQTDDVRISAIRSVDGYTKKEERHHLLLKDDPSSRSESNSFHNVLKAENGGSGCINIIMDDKHLDGEGYDDSNSHLSPTDYTEMTPCHRNSYDESYKSHQHPSLSPMSNNGMKESQSCNNGVKQKRNTILFPPSYKVHQEEKSKKSRSLPSLVESCVLNTQTRDITSTPLYREIYTNNIRQYSFLLAKKLGTSNQSPQELRKLYMQNRTKAVARGTSTTRQQRETRTGSSENICKDDNGEHCPNEKHSFNEPSSINSEPVSSGSRPNSFPGKHRGSFTDIASILCQCDHKSLTSEHSNSTDIAQHSPLCNASNTVNNQVDRSNDVEGSAVCQDKCEHDTSFFNYDRRQNEADIRQQARVARLNSFDKMVKNANSFLKDLKPRKKFSKSMDAI